MYNGLEIVVSTQLQLLKWGLYYVHEDSVGSEEERLKDKIPHCIVGSIVLTGVI